MDKERKAELKRSYAEARNTAGVLCVRNLESGKVYIAGSPDVRALENRLRSELRFIGCRVPGLQADWNALGAEGFGFEVLESFEPGQEDSPAECRELVREMETAWIRKLESWGERGYNKEPVEK